MSNAGTLYAIVPILNEEDNIPQLLNSFSALKDQISNDLKLEVIAVDDGSRDRTSELLGAQSMITLLRHPSTQGPGAAFATAFEYLATRVVDSDWILTMEGDNTSRTETILQMLRRRKEGYEIVLACPYMYGGGVVGVALHRSLLGHAANILAKSLLGLRGIHNIACFLRLYQGGAIQKLQQSFGPRILEFKGFECMVELLLKIVILRLSLSEVEMLLDWRPRKGKSKMKLGRAMYGYLKLLAKGWSWRRQQGANFWRPVT